MSSRTHGAGYQRASGKRAASAAGIANPLHHRGTEDTEKAQPLCPLCLCGAFFIISYERNDRRAMQPASGIADDQAYGEPAVTGLYEAQVSRDGRHVERYAPNERPSGT